MKINLTFLLLVLALLILKINGFSQEDDKMKCLVLSGTYQGENIFLRNPTNDNGVGYAIKSIKVNNELTTTDISNSAIELVLNEFSISDSVFVQIQYTTLEVPVWINSKCLLPRTTTTFTKIAIQDENTLTWSTENENFICDFKIEQYRWNRWITVGYKRGIGGTEAHNYSFEVSAFIHSNENTFRVKQVGFKNKQIKSENFKLISSLKVIDISTHNAYCNFYFPNLSIFLVFNTDGEIIQKGYSEKVSLPRGGFYFINFNNTSDFFHSK